MEVHPWSWIYFVTFVLITVFIVINVLIAVPAPRWRRHGNWSAAAGCPSTTNRLSAM